MSKTPLPGLAAVGQATTTTVGGGGALAEAQSVMPVVTPGQADVPVTPVTLVRKSRRSEFQKLRTRVALSVEACADLCGVTVRTVHRWDVEGAPFIAMRLLHLYDRRDLGGHGHEWFGWCFSRGKLMHGRKKLSFTPPHLEQAVYYAKFYSKIESARIRYQLDGILPTEALAMIFDFMPSPTFVLDQGNSAHSLRNCPGTGSDV